MADETRVDDSAGDPAAGAVTLPKSSRAVVPAHNWRGTFGLLFALAGLAGLALITLQLLDQIDILAPLALWKIVALGGLAPLAMFLSATAIFREPKGAATGGVGLGLLGTLWLLGVGMYVMADRMDLFTDPEERERRQLRVTVTAVDNLAARIGSDTALLRDTPRGEIRQSDVLDGWDRPLKYVIEGESELKVMSAGPDGEFGNVDDITNRDTAQLKSNLGIEE